MIKFYCNKLGRDKGLESFKEQNISPRYKLLTGQELCAQLKRKLIEEADEVRDALSKNEITAELADVLEVVDGLCKAYGIDPQELARVKTQKYQDRGGFEKGLFIEYLEMDETNPRVKHFRASPDKYPEK